MNQVGEKYIRGNFKTEPFPYRFNNLGNKKVASGWPRKQKNTVINDKPKQKVRWAFDKNCQL